MSKGGVTELPGRTGINYPNNSTHMEKIKLVSIKVSKISGVKARHALSGRTLIRASQFQGLGVQSIHLFIAVHCQGDHRAITRCCRIAVKRHDYTE